MEPIIVVSCLNFPSVPTEENDTPIEGMMLQCMQSSINRLYLLDMNTPPLSSSIAVGDNTGIHSPFHAQNDTTFYYLDMATSLASSGRGVGDSTGITFTFPCTK